MLRSLIDSLWDWWLLFSTGPNTSPEKLSLAEALHLTRHLRDNSVSSCWTCRRAERWSRALLFWYLWNWNPIHVLVLCFFFVVVAFFGCFFLKKLYMQSYWNTISSLRFMEHWKHAQWSFHYKSMRITPQLQCSSWGEPGWLWKVLFRFGNKRSGAGFNHTRMAQDL